ncbi:hypothetical protein LCGC14_3030780, partial [marine sediment metagenome]
TSGDIARVPYRFTNDIGFSKRPIRNEHEEESITKEDKERIYKKTTPTIVAFS